MNPFVYKRLSLSQQQTRPQQQLIHFTINQPEDGIYDAWDIEISQYHKKSNKLIGVNIEKIRTAAISDNNDKNCIICFDIKDPVIVMVCCKAYFCSECISTWLEQKSNCPHCRYKDPVFIEL